MLSKYTRLYKVIPAFLYRALKYNIKCPTLHSEFSLAQCSACRVLSHTYICSRVRQRCLRDLQTSIRQDCETSTWHEARDVMRMLQLLTYTHSSRQDEITCCGYINAFLLPGDGGSGWACGPAGQGNRVIQDHIQDGRMRLYQGKFCGERREKSDAWKYFKRKIFLLFWCKV